MFKKCNEVEKIIGYKFNNKKLLQKALTHSSKSTSLSDNYELYEFLGDSILNYIVTNFLFNNLQSSVGNLSKVKSKIVSTKYLSKIITELKLEKYILVGNTVVEIKDNIKADVFESLLCAVYLDSNLKNAEKFVMQFLIKDIANIQKQLCENYDYKSILQEQIQNKRVIIKYETISQTGKSNNPSFVVALLVNNKEISREAGGSKKEAEQLCAKKAIEKLNIKK